MNPQPSPPLSQYEPFSLAVYQLAATYQLGTPQVWCLSPNEP